MASLPPSDRPRQRLTGGPQGFPPRSGLPRGVIVLALPWVGTTWYERGRPYWLRRLGLILFSGFSVTLFGGILALFLNAVHEDSPRAFYILLGIETAFSLITGGYLVYRTIRHPAPLSDILNPHKRSWTRFGRWGVGIGVLARAGSALAGALVVLVAALTVGVLLGVLMRSFTPVLPTERQARQKLAEQLRARGYDIPDE